MVLQRLKGAIDSRIAEEQARQRQATQYAAAGVSNRPPARSDTRGTGSRPERTSSRQREKEGATTENNASPDPSVFEPEFAIGGDDDSTPVPSRVSTPKPQIMQETEKKDQGESANRDREKVRPEYSREVASLPNGTSDETITNKDSFSDHRSPALRTTELPTEFRVKLRKLDRLEGRYQELLEAYKGAHARVQQIQLFEASLRENTPLTSISDPVALVEYVNQTTLRSGMLFEELRRVTSDRDDSKKKQEGSEKIIAELRQEIDSLRAEQQHAASRPEEDQTSCDRPSRPSVEVKTEDIQAASTSPSSVVKSPTNSISSRVPSFSIFSPKVKARSPPPKGDPEDFFSYDTELPRLESELHERQAENEGLKQQITSLKGDLAVARESTGSMVESLETATRELHTLRDAKDKFGETKLSLEGRAIELRTRAQNAEEQCDKIERQLKQLHEERDGREDAHGALSLQLANLQTDFSVSKESLEQEKQLTQILNEKLGQKDATVKDLEDTLAMYKSSERQQSNVVEENQSSEKRLATMQSLVDVLKTQLKSAENTVAELMQDLARAKEEFTERPSTKVFGFLDEAHNESALDKLETREDVVRYLSEQFRLSRSEHEESKRAFEPSSAGKQADITSTSASGKRKKNRKKKAKMNDLADDAESVTSNGPVKVTEDLADADNDASEMNETGRLQVLQQEYNNLRGMLESKSSEIDRLSARLKDQEALQEEIETLRDDLLHQGEEHVEARDRLKEALAQKKVLEELVETLEREQATLREQTQSTTEADKNHTELLAQFEDFSAKSATLQTDLAAAEALASARFKDITDLREVLSKAQPELRSLRNEVVELKSAKDELRNKIVELNRLEVKQEDLKSEMRGLSKRLGTKDAEVKDLNAKVGQEANAKIKAEDDARDVRSGLKDAQNRQQELTEENQSLCEQLARHKDDSNKIKVKLRSLEAEAEDYTKHVSNMQEEISLKTALHATSQSLVQSLRGQTHELSTQARESSARAESLEEELMEAQRLLSERTREATTMRMLLSQAETGTESRLRETRERMEAAVEERDRIEDEASVSSRRMTRELDDARNKVREMQRAVRSLEEEKEDWHSKQRDFRRKNQELENAGETAKTEIQEVRNAMTSLREALDLAENQVRDLESQRTHLRRDLEEGRDRVENLVKHNKALTDDLKVVQEQQQQQQSTTKRIPARPGTGLGSGVQSSRSSLESTSASTTRSPVPSASGAVVAVRDRERSAAAGQAAPTVSGAIDYVYLKNVLLQFLEQRDKNYQKQLVPVLAMLLHFDRKEEQKWMAAINSR